jgi:hypothetical protein
MLDEEFTSDLNAITSEAKSPFIQEISTGRLSAPQLEEIVRSSADQPIVYTVIEPQNVGDLTTSVGIAYKNLSDSGCTHSCVDFKLIERLGIPITPHAGFIKLAEQTRKPRIGRTPPLQVTLVFWGGSTVCSPIRLLHSFEVMDGVYDDHNKNYFLFGQDLMDKCVNELQHRSNDVSVLMPFFTGIPIRMSSVRTETNSEIMDTPTIVSSYLDELEPNRAELSTEEALEAEFSRNRSEILRHPEIVREIEINSQITGVCNHPDAIVRLQLKENADMSKLFRRQYPIPEVKKALISAKIQKWMDKGRIEKAPPHQIVNNPLLCVPKKEGGVIVPNDGRVCIDPRPVNESLETDDRFEIPQIRRTLENFAGARIFGELDLEEAFLQFPVHKDSRKFLVFTWEGQQYWFTSMPFGVKFMTSFCHRFMCDQFKDLLFVDPFIDNLPWGSADWSSHQQHLLALLRRCNELNLKIKPSSIKVGHSLMRCLGHILSATGVSMDPTKMDSIRNWPTPASGAQLQSFLGLASFVRQHVRHYADLSAPLEAVKLEKILSWNDLLDQHFQSLKQAILAAPMLRFPDYSRPFYMATDASNSGVGGVLYQPLDGEVDISVSNIVAICSKKLNPSQCNYSAYKKELYGLVYSFRKFHQYIWGRTDTVVYTDHKPLIYMFSSVELSAALHQWMDVILDYNFTVRHRPGILNIIPDALSRMYSTVYSGSAWGVPSTIKFEPTTNDMFPSDTTLPSPSLAGARLDSSSESHPTEDTDLLSLRIEMEKRGKIIPVAMEERTRLIQHEHALGHFGRDAVFNKLYAEKNYWWPKMREEIQQELSQCDACARFVVHKAGFKPAMFIMADGPWSHVQMDCSTHLPPSPEGYTALLVFICVFSGFVALFPIKTTSAICVAEKLWFLCSLLGFPKILQSDNGTEFANKVVHEMVQLMRIDRRFIAPYNPRCDGKVERAIGVIMSVIKKLLQGSEQHWPLFVPLAQLCVNNKISSLTQSTPFSLMFARELHGFNEFSTEKEAMSIQQWKDYQKKVMSIIYPAINLRVREVKEKMIESVDQSHRVLPADSFPVDAVVMLKDPKKQDKREPHYVGPYRILEKDRNGNCVLKEDFQDGATLDRHVPPDQLKLLSTHKTEQPSRADDDIYIVKKILEHKGNPGDYSYLIHWKGYSIEESTWEPAENILDSGCVKAYWKAKKLLPTLKVATRSSLRTSS